MPGRAYATTDHAKIRQWAEVREGRPAIVAATKDRPGGGVVRIQFLQDVDVDDELEEISWKQFFQIFDSKELAFLYQELTDQGEASRFCKLVYKRNVTELLGPPEPDYRSHSTGAHEKIRRWVEVRGGRPAMVTDTRQNPDGGVLRIHFPDSENETALEPVSWEEFFEVFERKNLAFVYQEQTRDGEESRFCKFIADD